MLNVFSNVSFTGLPVIVTSGDTFTVKWYVNLTGATTNHTAVHFGSEKVPSPVGASSYPLGTTHFCMDAPCALPREFSANLTLNLVNNTSAYYHFITSGRTP